MCCYQVSKGLNQDTSSIGATVLANWAASTDQIKVPLASIVKGQLLGQGRFGDVFQGGLMMASNSLSSCQPIILRLMSAKQEDLMVEFKRQIDVFHRVKHANLAAVIGYCQDAEMQFGFIIETLPEQVSLKSYLLLAAEEDDAISNSCLHDMTLQIARGMNALAKAGLVHRDLGTRNILSSCKDKTQVIYVPAILYMLISNSS